MMFLSRDYLSKYTLLIPFPFELHRPHGISIETCAKHTISNIRIIQVLDLVVLYLITFGAHINLLNLTQVSGLVQT